MFAFFVLSNEKNSNEKENDDDENKTNHFDRNDRLIMRLCLRISFAHSLDDTRRATGTNDDDSMLILFSLYFRLVIFL